jgi:hypothetical protein
MDGRALDWVVSYGCARVVGFVCQKGDMTGFCACYLWAFLWLVGDFPDIEETIDVPTGDGIAIG